VAQRAPLLVEWGAHEGEPCVRVTGGATDAAAEELRVYPTEVARSGTAGLPPMAGRHGTDGTTVWFVPRFGFVPGT
jgi:hypothetical protein